MTAHTLTLGDDWDLHVNASGGLDAATGAYAIAQNVANAFRLFTKDAYYFQDRGIPHFAIELRAHPKLQVLRARLKKAALAVEGVKDAQINLMDAVERELNGFAVITLQTGEQFNVGL